MRLKSKIIILTFFIFFAILAFFSYFYIKDQLFSPVSKEESEKIFEIEEGQGVLQIVDSLKKEGFIKNKWVVLGYLKFNSLDKNLRAGIFVLKKNLSPAETLKIIISGKTALKKITILEGWNTKEIADYLDERGIVKKEDFLDTLKKESWNYDFLADTENLEGYLFPDTYYVSYKADAREIIQKMLDNFDKKLNPKLKEEIKEQGKSIKDVIILASIVEREVLKDEDRKIVAGVFLKRIDQDKPLEADSTINYITGKNSPQPTFDDTRTSSPYNTYLNKGLPPGPISNPGLSSILASVYPENSPYLFYLNRQDTGETVFSRTYKEHLENKNKYLK